MRTRGHNVAARAPVKVVQYITGSAGTENRIVVCTREGFGIYTFYFTSGRQVVFWLHFLFIYDKGQKYKFTAKISFYGPEYGQICLAVRLFYFTANLNFVRPDFWNPGPEKRPNGNPYWTTWTSSANAAPPPSKT